MGGLGAGADGDASDLIILPCRLCTVIEAAIISRWSGWQMQGRVLQTDFSPMKEKLSALTALRALVVLAAIAVVLQHYTATTQTFAVRNILSLAPHRYIAGDAFFANSGFIITHRESYCRGGAI